jgi:hypothetical protein
MFKAPPPYVDVTVAFSIAAGEAKLPALPRDAPPHDIGREAAHSLCR